MKEISGPRKPQSKRAFWSQHIENQKRSDVTQAQYCLEHNLKKPTFQYWKSRLQREGRSHLLVPVAISSHAVSEVSSRPSNDSVSSAAGIHLNIKGRFVEGLEQQFSAPALSKLIGILESL